MIWLLLFGLLWLTGTGLVLIRNTFEFAGLRNVHPAKQDSGSSISICIPARNEENSIEHCVRSVATQTCSQVEILVLDDQSSDQTSYILNRLQQEFNSITILQGKPKPNDWLGKPWACHQLSERANGEYLLFIDADVWLEPDTLRSSLEAMQEWDMITVWPQQVMHTFWEHAIIPRIYFALWTLLPARYVERAPRWMPASLRTTFSSTFAAACGQFIMFRKQAYHAIGGHESVKQDVVEDVQLAKKIKAQQFRLKMYHGSGQVYCRMYNSLPEIWNGLRKNFFLGFDQNVVLFLFMAIVHGITFLLPFAGIGAGFVSNSFPLILLSINNLALILLQHVLIYRVFNWRLMHALLFPLGVLWYQALGIQCLWDYVSGNKPTWKGRTV
ncbi:MAG: glycosyltransferase family 2 protein [Bacteroidota bacterium]